MKRFDKEAMDQLKRSVYQSKPFILVSLDEEIGFSMSGNKAKLEQALRTAMNNDSAFRQMVKNALSAPRPTDQVRVQTRFTSHEVPQSIY